MPLLKRALQNRPDPQDEAQIYELMAYVHVIYGRSRKARNAFVKVLELNADFEVPVGESPKVRSAFESAQEEFKRREARKRNRAARNPEPAEDTPIESEPVEEDSTDEETPPEDEPEEISATDFDEDPGTLTLDEQLQLDEGNSISAVDGDDERFYNKWWFWSIVGAVVVAGGALTYMVAVPQEPNHDYGPIPLGP